MERSGAYRMVARAESSIGVTPSPELTRRLEEILGPNTIRYKVKALRLNRPPGGRVERTSGRVLG